jgi:hypothetical protein
MASCVILFSNRIRSETGTCEPLGIATTAPGFLIEGPGPVPEFGQARPKQSGEPQSSLTAHKESNRHANQQNVVNRLILRGAAAAELA